MGCVSSSLLNQEDEFTQLGSSAFSHHIVSLTSTTYGLLTLESPPHQPSSVTPMTPPQRFTFGSIFPSPLSNPKAKSLWSEPRVIRSEPEVINSWELMSGLDTESFRFSPAAKTMAKENANLKGLIRFEKLCPPEGEMKLVMYTTSLRGIRRTFEACNAVRAAIGNLGVSICERDISMDRGFKEELTELMRGKPRDAMVPPRVFVQGRYIGGAEEVLKIVEEGWIGDLVSELPKRKGFGSCHGCGGIGFLPCIACNGSCKVVQGRGSDAVVLRCPTCNENGLVRCPICSSS